MEAIAAEAAVTKPTLYREIGDKDALVEALAERLVDRIIAAVGAGVAGQAGAQAQLRGFVSAYLDVVERDRALYLYVTAGGTSDDRLRQALHLADRSAAPIAEQLAAQRVADGADPSVAVVWSYGLIGMLHFVTLWWMRDGEVDRDRLTDQVTELMWSGLGNERAAARPRRRADVQTPTTRSRKREP